jgi:hypothetical protein
VLRRSEKRRGARPALVAQLPGCARLPGDQSRKPQDEPQQRASGEAPSARQPCPTAVSATVAAECSQAGWPVTKTPRLQPLASARVVQRSPSTPRHPLCLTPQRLCRESGYLAAPPYSCAGTASPPAILMMICTQCKPHARGIPVVLRIMPVTRTATADLLRPCASLGQPALLQDQALLPLLVGFLAQLFAQSPGLLRDWVGGLLRGGGWVRGGSAGCGGGGGEVSSPLARPRHSSCWWGVGALVVGFAPGRGLTDPGFRFGQQPGMRCLNAHAPPPAADRALPGLCSSTETLPSAAGLLPAMEWEPWTVQ